MSDATLLEVQQALADQIQSVLCGTADPLIEQLEVSPVFDWKPSPPAIDIYPADPFQEHTAFGKANNQVFYLVRARVLTADDQSGQELLLSLMDPRAATNMQKAILANRTLSGKVSKIGTVEPPSSFGTFPDAGGGGALMGCTWRVVIFL